MPSAEIWEEFPVVALLALFLLLIGAGARMMFHELRTWQKEQDMARETEREKQRAWQEEQDTKTETARAAREKRAEEELSRRDAQWQNFFERMNNGNLDTIGKLTQVNRQLVERIDTLTVVMREHDGFVRERLPGGAAVDQPIEMVDGTGRGSSRALDRAGKRGKV